MRALSIIVALVAGLGGCVFAYFIVVFGMFFNLQLGHVATPLMILVPVTPLAGIIGGALLYFKPPAARSLIALSAAGWIAIALLVVYARVQDQTKLPLSVTDTLMFGGVLLIPAVVSLLAWWLASLAARRAA